MDTSVAVFAETSIAQSTSDSDLRCDVKPKLLDTLEILVKSIHKFDRTSSLVQWFAAVAVRSNTKGDFSVTPKPLKKHERI